MSRQSGTLSGTCRLPHRFKVPLAENHAFGRPVHWRSTEVQAWPIWQLPRWLRVFVIAVVIADGVVLGLAASEVRFQGRDLVLFGGLLASSAATVELTRRAGENNGVVKDVYATWELPAALLLPLAYVPVLPIVRMALTQWRVHRGPVYRRVVSAAVVGLSYVAAAFAFHILIRLVPGAEHDPDSKALAWMLIAAASAAVQWTVNQVLLCTAVKGSNPDIRILDEVLSKEHVFNDVTELCVAVIVSFCVAASAI